MFWSQHMTGLGWGGWLLGSMMMLLFWGGSIGLVFLAIRAFIGSSQKQPGDLTSSETALGILKKRYARGEIDKDEYEAKRRDIET